MPERRFLWRGFTSRLTIRREVIDAMNREQQTQAEKDALYAAHVAKEEDDEIRQALGLIGKHLVALGTDLQHHPEQVSPLRDPHLLHDYTSGLDLLRDRPEVVRKCQRLRELDQELKAAQRRLIGSFS